jgi:hypothetical protein
VQAAKVAMNNQPTDGTHPASNQNSLAPQVPAKLPLSGKDKWGLARTGDALWVTNLNDTSRKLKVRLSPGNRYALSNSGTRMIVGGGEQFRILDLTSEDPRLWNNFSIQGSRSLDAVGVDDDFHYVCLATAARGLQFFEKRPKMGLEVYAVHLFTVPTAELVYRVNEVSFTPGGVIVAKLSNNERWQRKWTDCL